MHTSVKARRRRSDGTAVGHDEAKVPRLLGRWTVATRTRPQIEPLHSPGSASDSSEMSTASLHFGNCEQAEGDDTTVRPPSRKAPLAKASGIAGYALLARLRVDN